MPCKQNFLNYLDQNEGNYGLLQLCTIELIFLEKEMNSGKKNVKIRDFLYLLFEPTKIQNMDEK